MARRAPGAWATRQAAELVSGMVRDWEHGTKQALPLQVRRHLRAAAREGLLAVALLCEGIVHGAERQARAARRRIERIPAKDAAPSRSAPRPRRRR
jgi:hypothetical protein